MGGGLTLPVYIKTGCQWSRLGPVGVEVGQQRKSERMAEQGGADRHTLTHTALDISYVHYICHSATSCAFNA